MWQQREGLNPKPKVVHSPFTFTAFSNHISSQIQHYGNQTLVNLINKHPSESYVGEVYETLVRIWNDIHSNNTDTNTDNTNTSNTLNSSNTLSSSSANSFDSSPEGSVERVGGGEMGEEEGRGSRIKFHWFDFHEKCKKNKYENVEELMEEIREELVSSGYFLEDFQHKPLQMQKGVVRTNCIDCLDRTNVVQSCIAKKVLAGQLSHLGIIQNKEMLSNYSLFETIFQNAWADNADVMSIRYTGTGALKTDFTRTGKRSVAGLLQDGMSSVKRMVNSVLLDKDKQESIDLFLGNIEVRTCNLVPSLFSLPFFSFC